MITDLRSEEVPVQAQGANSRILAICFLLFILWAAGYIATLWLAV